MWRVWLSFALALQVCFIAELVLNRMISIFSNKARNPVRKLADGSFFASAMSTLASAALTPVKVAGMIALFVWRKFWTVLCWLLVIAVLAVLSEASGSLLVLIANVYNRVLGEWIFVTLTSVFGLLASCLRVILPFWNAGVYIVVVFWTNTFLPFVFVNVDVIPALLLDLTMTATTLGFSLKAYIDVVLQCATAVIEVDETVSPFWVNDLKCVASPYAMTLDLMTPGIFVQKSAVHIQQMLQGSCSSSTSAVTLLMYPLIDYNMYKALHGAVNAVLHVFVAMPLWTSARCAYAEKTTDHVYTALERKVMCVPDMSAPQSILRGTLQSLGAFVDNYLDMALVTVETAVTGSAPTCAHPTVRAVWESASDVFATRKLQVVGLTASLYAVTDGTSAQYQSMSGAGMRSSVALNTWPFLVDVSHGVAAVRYSDASDPDDDGDERTGMFGCRCIDEADGLQILCASVPYQTHLSEDEAENEAATVHRVRFMNERARLGLTCATVVVRVNALRFSRRRFSTPSLRPTVEGGFQDPFDTRGDTGAKYGHSHAADASVVVMPLCTVEGSVFCIPSPDNCYPFCMGLHAAGQTTQNISLMNSGIWNEYTSLGQTDCVVTEAVQGLNCAVSLLRSQALVVNEGRGLNVRGCSPTTACSPDASTTTYVRQTQDNPQNRSLSAWNANETWGFIRSNDQPFVVAGDIFLYQKQTDDHARSGLVFVTRLYDNKRGDFSLQNEQLSLVTNSDALTYAECTTELCFDEQLRSNHIVLPDQFFTRASFVSTVSEWAVHWIATPDLNKCAFVFDYCAGTTGPVLSERMHRPRVWTIRTVRSTDDLGRVDTTEQHYASFMLIPGWFTCELSEDQQCQRMASMKVTGLEYLNADNLLLTVLAASPAHWDAGLDDVRAGMPFEYRYYFIHPNRHDCTSPGHSDDPVYTCWREHIAGMYNASDSRLAEAGSLCPAMQRMPKWGSLAAEVGIGTVHGLTMLLDLLVGLPVLLSVPGGMVDVFDARTHPTFHSMLDTNGARLFDFEEIILAVDRAAFHAGNTLGRISMLFDDRPGFEVLKPVLIGTGRIYQYTVGQSQMEDLVMGSMAGTLRGVPLQAFASKFSQATQTPPETPISVAGSAGKTNLVQMFTSAFSSGVSWNKIMLRMSRKMALKLLRRPRRAVKALGLDDMARMLMVSAYDSENDMKRGLFLSMRVVCDSAGQVIGRSTPWGQFVRHSCMIWPDSLEAAIKVMFVLFVDYPVMDCVCKQPNGYNAAEILESVCLPRIMPMAAKAFVLVEMPDADPSAQRKSQCFVVMDSVNDKLLKAMDPVLSRMYKAQTALESGIAAVLAVDFSGTTTSGAGCSDFGTSPFVVSILPEPVDYFMGCMDTIDCRSRCLDPMRAFEASLNAYRAVKGEHPGLQRVVDIQTNSLYFSSQDEFDGKHLAPFAVYSVMLMQPDVCTLVCSLSWQDSSRCVSVAGMDTADESSRVQGLITQAYYCVPASVTLSVFRGSVPGSRFSAASMYADDTLGDAVVTAMTHGTTYKAMNGTSEWLVIATRDADTGEGCVRVMSGGDGGVSLLLLQTVDFYLSTFADTHDVNDFRWNVQQVNKIFVLAAHSNRRWMTVYVSASRTTPDLFEDKVCVYFYVDTASTGALYDGVMRDCSAYHDKVFSENQRLVCLDSDCRRVLRIPYREAQVTVDKLKGYQASDADDAAAFDWTVVESLAFQMSRNQRAILDMSDTMGLTVMKDNRVQLTSRQLSAVGKVDTLRPDGSFAVHVAMTGRADSQEVWLQNINVDIPAVVGNAVQLVVAPSFPVKQRLEMVMNCSVSTCQGCQGSGPLDVDLQNKCYSAASCGIARCVGTLVNMQRPLCQMASLIGANADAFRIQLGAFWSTLSRTIIGIVELSAHRRAAYEVSWPAEIVQMGVCNVKDSVIEFWAVFGAMAGAASKVDSNNAASYTDTSMSVSKEARTAGIRVMAATAFVELMSHWSMGVVYAPIIAWKMMECQLNSAFVVLSGGSDVMRVGTAKFDKGDEAAIGMCIGEKVKQELRDMANPHVDESLQKGLAAVGSNLVSMYSSRLMGPTAFVLDGYCAWALGVIKGLMNVVQVLDWTKCKLPDIQTAVVSRCVCGDKAARIPTQQRAAKRASHALWCYGPLMLTDTDGKDLLIWNPYSLSELLEDSTVVSYLDCISMNRCNFAELVPASTPNGTMEDYLECLRKAPFVTKNFDAAAEAEFCVRFKKYTDCVDEKVDCNALKPRKDVFDAQGVEVMQVITRCRNNYQQKKWDEAAVMLGLLDFEAWTSGTPDYVKALSRVSDEDYLSVYRRHMSKLADFIESFTDLDVSTWMCLRAALQNKRWKHDCAELAYSNRVFPSASDALTYFEYDVNSDDYSFMDMDACQSFSGKVQDKHDSTMTYPKMVWDGDSANAVPVAELHVLRQKKADDRRAQAELELDDLIKNTVMPALDWFTKKRLDEIMTTFWAVEGDYIHQLIDCFILGPYAAADMLPSFNVVGRRFKVPQYHRGSSESREIAYSLHVQGSLVRRNLMDKVVHHVSQVKDEILLRVVTETIDRLRRTYKEKGNLYCQCTDGSRSLLCCMSNHEDIESFGNTFAAQSIVRAVKDAAPQFLAEISHSISNTTLLTKDLWTEDEFAFEFEFDEDDAQMLAETYLFDFNDTVYHYDQAEIRRSQRHTLWSMCVSTLRASFFSMPAKRRADDELEVDADTIFDPTQFPAHDAERYLHGMEQFVERMLEKAKKQSPVFWSHVHRYMPSDSVWCEGDSEPADSDSATVAEQLPDVDLDASSVRAPDVDNVLYVGQALYACVCGAARSSNGTCLLPPSICEAVQPAPEHSNQWTALCADGQYASPADFMFVRHMVETNYMMPPGCLEYASSTVWGLMDSKQHLAWYNGSRDAWRLSPHEIAATGPAGTRLSDFRAAAPRDFGASNAWARGPAAGIFNTHYEHTIAQPVCSQSAPEFLKQNLSDYFREVLFPMAHSIHESPSQAICGRWVVEYCMFVFLLKATGNDTALVDEQRRTEQQWRLRCHTHLEQVGICNLRGVYALAPTSHQSAKHCPFTVPENHTCALFYVTDDCLLMCNGVVYDPCLCDGAVDCRVSFAEHSCTAARVMLPPSTDLDLASMHWASTAWPPSTVMQDALDRVNANATQGVTFYLDDDMTEYVLKHADKAEGDLGDAFCDDLVDYMHPDAQHPVGYHPTTSCFRAQTNMRGFDSWMTTGGDAAWSIDPVRMRNMSAYSTTLGSAHLTCDAAVYGTLGRQLNNLFMQSKWSDTARADPAVPVPPDRVDPESMAFFGESSMDPQDTPLQANADSHALFQHTVGLVRDWLRYYADDDDQGTIQLALDDLWPHWQSVSEDSYGARPSEPLHDGCVFPPLFTCHEHADCQDTTGALKCLLVSTDEDTDTLGICAAADTCFRHSHCSDAQLCSGKGVCADPEITVHNDHERDIDVQMHAFDSRQCLVSPYGLGKHENIPTFARDNGLCGVRNFFNYNETTYADRQQPLWDRTDVLAVADRLVRPFRSGSSTTAAEVKMLTDSTSPTLFSHAHECDRTYEHSDHKLCAPYDDTTQPEGIQVSRNSDSPSPNLVRATRMWSKTANGINMKFCNLYTPSGGFGEILAPYHHTDESTMEQVDTLRETRRDIKRCLDFNNICMDSPYTVRGNPVSVRLVSAAAGFRKYHNKDVELCMSFGVWNEDTKQCSLDRMIVPLFGAIYPDATNPDASKQDLDTLRGHCPQAFGTVYDDARARFEATYVQLKEPYTPADKTKMHAIVNGMLLQIFDMMEDTSRNRGLPDMHSYTQKAKCIKHLYERLDAAFDANGLELAAYGVDPSEAPGRTLYMFSGIAPVEVSLLWFWKCVVVALQTEGGASVQWLRIMTSDAQEGLQCANLDLSDDVDMTLRRHLQLESNIYISSVVAQSNVDMYKDITDSIADTINFWDIYPVPTIHCYEHNDECETSDLQFGNAHMACHRTAAPDTTVAPDPTAQEVKITLVEILVLFLFQHTEDGIQKFWTHQTIHAMSGIPLSLLLTKNLAVELSLDTRLSRTVNYTNAIPVFELTALKNMSRAVLEAEKQNYRIPTAAAGCALNATSRRVPLVQAEYQILRTACAPSEDRQTEQSRMYHKIMLFREMQESIALGKFENYECYPTDNDMYDTVSQKTALLLLTYYLREILYSSTKTKLGRLDADQKVRNLMRADAELTRNMPKKLNEAREYDLNMRTRQFLCDEDKRISDYQRSGLQDKMSACYANLKEPTGWQVPSRRNAVNSVTLQPRRDVFVGGFFLSFSTRESDLTFLDELANTEWHTADNMYGSRQMCFKSTGGATRLAPLWSGDLDVQSCPFGPSCGCETTTSGAQSYMDITCDGSDSLLSCASDFPAFYAEVSSKMYEDCAAKQAQSVPLADYEQMQNGNLCARRPRDAATCSTKFGAVGGVVGNPAQDLHVTSPVLYFQAGLFNKDSTLLAGLVATDTENVTSIRMKDTDIGGHSVAATVVDLGGASLRNVVMVVTCVSAGSNCRGKYSSRWLRQAESLWKWQHVQHKARSVRTAALNVRWSCPLQWLSAYGDNRTSYAARTPTASRNAHRFRHITGDNYFAHAVVATTLRSAQHPARFMSDASACADARVTSGGLEFSCRGRGFLHAAARLHNGAWTPVEFHSSSPPCVEILDWPHRAFKTMDGGLGGNTPDKSRYCNVFDRLPSFALSYAKSPAVLSRSTYAPSTSPGGACHMGRLKKFERDSDEGMLQLCTAFPAHSRCRVLRRNADWNTTGQQEFSWSQRDIPVQEPYKAHKQEPTRKRKCSRCETHEQASFVDRRSREKPLSDRIRQLSVGLPTAIASERAIAAHLRRKLCAASEDCAQLFDVLPRDSWQQHKLLRGLLNLSRAHQHSTSPSVRDDDLWLRPWVFCKFNNGSATCHGSITKEEWKDPTRRAGACTREMLQGNQAENKPIRLCDLSEEMQALCVNLGTWNSKIEYILCKAAGHPQCSEQGFFYNPTAYSFSNQDFVYNTVRNMYHQLNDSACPAVYVNKQDLQNELLQGQCASVAILPLRIIVTTARSYAYDLMIIVYCGLSIGMHVLGIIVGAIGQLDSLIAECSRNLRMYISLYLHKINSIMDRIMKMLWQLADFGAFKFVKKAAASYCETLKYVITPLMHDTIHPMGAGMATFIRLIDRDLTRPVANFINTISFGTIPTKNMLETNQRNIDFWDKVAEDSRLYTAECDEGPDVDKSTPVGVLPVATKCWSTYTTFFGDNSMLSCTGADTCHRGVMDTTLVTCGTCPEPQSSFRQFGCLDVTKICTCGVSVLSLQYCTANEDCTPPESSCKYLDSELEPSIGFTPCPSCQSSRLCYMQPGMSLGYCACGLFDIKYARCLDHAKNVNPGYDDMCIFTSDPNFLRSVTFTFSFDTSISTPCRMINPAFSFCARETNGKLYIVGTDISRRRHLLQVTSGDEEVHIDTVSALCQDALASDALPRTRANCVALYHDSLLTVQELGLEGTLPACAFCGLEDAFAAFVLRPQNIVALTTNISSVVKIVARHTPLKHLFSTFKLTRRYVEVVLHSVANGNKDDLPEIRYTQTGWRVHITSNDTAATFVLESLLPQVLNWVLLPHNESGALNDSRASRRLLGVADVVGTAADKFSAAMTQADTLHKTFQTQLSAAFTFPFRTIQHDSLWLSSWPPAVGRYSASADANKTCEPLMNVIRGMGWSFGNVTKSFETKITMNRKATLQAAWLVVPHHNDSNSSFAFDTTTEDIPTASVMWTARQILQTVGFELSTVYDLAKAAILEVPPLLRCNYESVQTCSRWDMHLLHACFVAAVYFYALSFVCYTLDIPLLAIVFIGGFPLVVMYMSYGYSPFCAPMVPVCLPDDIVWTIQAILPKFVVFPSSMFKNSACIPKPGFPVEYGCLLPCTDPRFNYRHWYDVGAWWAVEMGLAEHFETYAGFILSADELRNLQDQLDLKYECLLQNDAGLVTGNRICAALSLYKMLPWVFGMLVLVFMLGSIVQIVWTVVTSAIFSVFVLYITAFY